MSERETCKIEISRSSKYGGWTVTLEDGQLTITGGTEIGSYRPVYLDPEEAAQLMWDINRVLGRSG